MNENNFRNDFIETRAEASEALKVKVVKVDVTLKQTVLVICSALGYHFQILKLFFFKIKESKEIDSSVPP